MWRSTYVRRAGKHHCHGHARVALGTLRANADGSATAEYNYDEEPKWDVPVDPIAYVTDQDAFPRDEAHQPEWLKLKLAEGRARLAARDK